MRGILILAGITFIFSNCDTQKSTQTENGVSTTASKDGICRKLVLLIQMAQIR